MANCKTCTIAARWLSNYDVCFGHPRSHSLAAHGHTVGRPKVPTDRTVEFACIHLDGNKSQA